MLLNKIETVLAQYQVFLMNAGVEINSVYEKFLIIFAYFAGTFDRANYLEANFPFLNEVSYQALCRLNLSV